MQIKYAIIFNIEGDEYMDELIQMLHEEHLTCIVKQKKEIYKEYSNGIKPILNLLNCNHLEDALLADKVIGKAAALLMVYGKISAVHTDILSEHAKKIFDQYKIPYTYDLLVPYIINRTKTGMCPMEETVLNIDDPAIALEKLQQKVKELSKI